MSGEGLTKEELVAAKRYVTTCENTPPLAFPTVLLKLALDTCAALEEQLRWRVWMDEPPEHASDLVIVTHEDGTTWHAVGMAATIDPTRRCLWRPLHMKKNNPGENDDR